MSTRLGTQLKALASAQARDVATAINTKARTRPSLLFDPKQAADIDIQTVFSIAQTGLQELVEINSAFAAFRKTLFSTASTQTDRESQTKEFNDKLNVSIAEFFRLLAPHMLLPPSHQVLEYLIRRYKVYVYNVDDIMLSILPFHETTIFVRIIQLLKIEKTKWEFLNGVKQTGAFPPRGVLVQRCMHDMSLLEVVCETGSIGTKSHKSLTHMTFACVTIVETISAIPSVTKDLVNKVLPFILNAFSKGASEDYQAGCLMIVGVLASRATLSENLCTSLLEAMSKAAARTTSVSSSRLILMAIVEVIQTQELTSFPPKAFKDCLKITELPILLKDLTKAFDAEKFIKFFIIALAEQCVLHDYYVDIFYKMLEALPFQYYVEYFVPKLVRAALAADLQSTKDALQRVLTAIGKRYPSELDSSISSLLKEESESDEMLKALTEALEGSIRAPIGESRCSLYASLVHPHADVRKAAVERLCLSEQTDSNERELVNEALLQILEDSDLAVVQTVLSTDELEKRLPAERLVRCLVALLHRCMEMLQRDRKASDAKGVAETCLKLVKRMSSEMNSAMIKDVHQVLLCYVMLRPRTWKLNVRFLKALMQMPVPLFTYTEEEPMESSRANRASRNRKTVETIAEAVLKNDALLDLLMEAAVDNSNAKVLCALVVCKVSHGVKGELLEKCLDFVQQEWTFIVPGLDSDISKFSEMDYTSDKDDMYQRLEKEEKRVCTEAILFSFYSLIPSVLGSKDLNVARELFVFLADSPAWEVFKQHITFFMNHLQHSVVAFLLDCSNAQGVSALVQAHSLSVLGWYFMEHPSASDKDVALGIAGTFVCLGYHLPSVRAAAVNCLKSIKTTGSYAKLLEAVADNEKSFVNDGKYLSTFCKTFLDNQVQLKADIVVSLVKEVLELPLPVQSLLLDVLHDVGHTREIASATQSTLFELLERRRLHHLVASSSDSKALKEQEVRLLVQLLEVHLKTLEEIFCVAEYKETESHLTWALLEALKVDGGSLTDAAVVQPCLLVLQHLSPELYSHLNTQLQDTVFESLIELSSVPDDVIRPLARQVIDKLEITLKTVTRHLDSLYGTEKQGSGRKKKRSKRGEKEDGFNDWPADEKLLLASVGLLEFLLRKTKLNTWNGMLSPMFDVLHAHNKSNWPKCQEGFSEENVASVGQLVLSIIENVVRYDAEENGFGLDVELVVKYVNATNAETRNHALAVITAAGHRYPESVLPHVIDVLRTAGTAVVTEDDSHSHTLIHEMLASVVPYWLQKMKNPEQLFTVFLEALPSIPTHRQTDLIKCVLRVSNEETSISTFLLLLLQHATKPGPNDWAVRFAERLCTSYDVHVRTLAVVKLSEELQATMRNEESVQTLQLVTRFMSSQLKGLEIHTVDNDAIIQDACCTLMEHALRIVQLFGDRKFKLPADVRQSCAINADAFLDSVTKLMSPSVFCKTIAALLKNTDSSVRRKALQIYVAKLKLPETRASRRKGLESMFSINSDAHMGIMVEIAKLLESSEQVSSRTKQAAVSALEAAVQTFGSKCSSTLVSCLPAVLKNFEEPTKSLVVASVRCSGSIVIAGGTECLACLPAVMNSLMKIARSHSGEDEHDVEESILVAVEAIVDKLGAFLSPYVSNIVQLLISPEYVKLESTARLASVVATKVPARVLLDPLSSSYKVAVATSEASTALVFQMLATLCSSLERALVSTCDKKIFKFCLDALDLRRKQPESFTSVQLVEESVIASLTALVMKLSETSFRPMFVTAQEWALATVLDGEAAGQSIERSIAFYKLVNSLTEKLRSVFVPYFRYVLDGCLAHLGKVDGVKTTKTKKKKTVHVSEFSDAGAVAKWQLRYLVISALHKCFLYDTVGFLDAAKFQQLLPPLAFQLLEEVPSGVDEAGNKDVPTAAEMDEVLVSCLCRMALTAGNDTLWKPLNHEVLMKTRSDSVRAKLVALRIVKSLAENLKEEYMLLIPETIPFLSELLEDPDMHVVSNTQELIKMLEELSGESLAQYL